MRWFYRWFGYNPPPRPMVLARGTVKLPDGVNPNGRLFAQVNNFPTGANLPMAEVRHGAYEYLKVIAQSRDDEGLPISFYYATDGRTYGPATEPDLAFQDGVSTLWRVELVFGS